MTKLTTILTLAALLSARSYIQRGSWCGMPGDPLWERPLAVLLLN